MTQAADRCDATTGQRDLAWAIIRSSPLTGDESKQAERFRCQLPAGHDGQHRHSYQPFPGFANECIRWEGP